MARERAADKFLRECFQRRDYLLFTLFLVSLPICYLLIPLCQIHQRLLTQRSYQQGYLVPNVTLFPLSSSHT